MGAASCHLSTRQRGSGTTAPATLRRVRPYLVLAAIAAGVAGWMHLAVTLRVMH